MTTLDGLEFKNQGDCVSYVATNMCKDDGWMSLTKEDGSGFKNQGQCVSYFNHIQEDKNQYVESSSHEEQALNKTENSTEHQDNETHIEVHINETESQNNETKIQENNTNEIRLEEIVVENE